MPTARYTVILKIYYIISVQFCWAGMYKELIEEVLTYGHCRVGNPKSNKYKQHILSITMSLGPNEIILMDGCLTGKIMDATPTNPT